MKGEENSVGNRSITVMETKRHVRSGRTIAACLLLIHLDHIILLHLELQMKRHCRGEHERNVICAHRLRRVLVIDAPTIKEEAQRRLLHANTIAIALLELAHERRSLDAEVHLVRVLRARNCRLANSYLLKTHLTNDLQLDVVRVRIAAGLIGALRTGLRIILRCLIHIRRHCALCT